MVEKELEPLAGKPVFRAPNGRLARQKKKFCRSGERDKRKNPVETLRGFSTGSVRFCFLKIN